jgi:hypothetical protein
MNCWLRTELEKMHPLAPSGRLLLCFPWSSKIPNGYRNWASLLLVSVECWSVNMGSVGWGVLKYQACYSLQCDKWTYSTMTWKLGMEDSSLLVSLQHCDQPLVTDHHQERFDVYVCSSNRWYQGEIGFSSCELWSLECLFFLTAHYVLKMHWHARCFHHSSFKKGMK